MYSNFCITEEFITHKSNNGVPPEGLLKLIARQCKNIEKGTKDPMWEMSYRSKQEAPAITFGELSKTPIYTNTGKLSTKHENFVSSNILILDVDKFKENINVGDCQIILEEILGEDTHFLWWTTPSSIYYRPRVRALVVLNRNIDKNEYRDMAYRLPKHKDIECIDPASFRLGQFFIIPYIPSQFGNLGNARYSPEDEAYYSAFKWGENFGKPLDVDSLPPAPLKEKIEYANRKLAESDKIIREAIMNCIEIINDAPSGEGYETTKSALASLFGKHIINMDILEECAQYITSPKRQKHFEGIAKWLYNKGA